MYYLVANGIYQNSVYGTAAMFPMKYTSVVVLGSVSFLINVHVYKPLFRVNYFTNYT